MTESRRTLKVGLILPTWEGSWMEGRTPGWSDLQAMTKLAEEVGFDSVWLADHLLGDDADIMRHFETEVPDEVATLGLLGYWEVWSLMAALAAATDRITLGTLVTPTGYRNPALLAKIADTVDEISGGRIVLGLGAGDTIPEHRVFGFPTDHLVGRFEEALRIITSLLRTGAVDFQGQYYQARECELRPRGPRPDGLPIMVSAKGPRMLRLTAAYADALDSWIVFGGSTAAAVPPLREAIDAACHDVGRDPATLERWISAWVSFGDLSRESGAIAGTPEAMAEQLRAFAREGISQIELGFDPPELATIERMGPVLELLDRG